MAAPWPRVGGVYRLPGEQGWMVPSRSVPGAFRHVTWHADASQTPRHWFQCSCPCGQAREKMGSEAGAYPCRHVKAVAEAEQADGFPKPPVASVNVSALVD